MIDLDAEVFGRITAKEIIGYEPPIEELEKLLERELKSLTEYACDRKYSELEQIRDKQKYMQEQINSRRGAMALPQNKIRLYLGFCGQYLEYLDSKIKPAM